jgi:hypothetical protein
MGLDLALLRIGQIEDRITVLPRASKDAPLAAMLRSLRDEVEGLIVTAEDPTD